MTARRNGSSGPVRSGVARPRRSADAEPVAPPLSSDTPTRAALDTRSRLLARREAESIDELRAVHSARLEGVLSSFWPAATSGDTDAARIVLRTLDSLAKLYGLDAPRVAVGPTLSDVEFAKEAARLIESIASLGGTDDLLRSLAARARRCLTLAAERRCPSVMTPQQESTRCGPTAPKRCRTTSLG